MNRHLSAVAIFTALVTTPALATQIDWSKTP